MDNKGYISIDFASFWRRLGAICIDGLIIGLISLIIIQASSMTVGSIFITIIISFAYEVLSIYYYGMTLGKRAFRIRVISTLGDKLTLKQSFTRYFSKTLSKAFLSIGYLWMLFNDDRQTWHDKLASTIVILRINEDLIIEKITNNPWEESKKLKRNRTGALILTTLIFTGGILDAFVNDVGMFGLLKVDSIDINETIKDIRFLDVDGNGKKDIISLVVHKDKKVLNIYEWNEKKLVLKNSYDIEAFHDEDSKEDWGATFEVADLDKDKSLELVIVSSEDSTNRLLVYKEVEGIYKMMDSKEYSTVIQGYSGYFADIEIYQDENGYNHIIWTYNTPGKPRLYSYSFRANKLEEDFYEINDEMGSIISGDFDRNGKKELYLVDEDSDGVTINRLEYSDKSIKMHEAEQIKSWSINLNSISNSDEIKIDDFNNDGKDDIIFLTLKGFSPFIRKGTRKNPWLKVYTREGDKWKKIWSGGKRRENNLYATEYQGQCDIDGDGIEEIVITKHHIGNLFFSFDEKVNIELKNTIEIYKLDPIKFAINKFWQKAWYFQ